MVALALLGLFSGLAFADATCPRYRFMWMGSPHDFGDPSQATAAWYDLQYPAGGHPDRHMGAVTCTGVGPAFSGCSVEVVVYGNPIPTSAPVSYVDSTFECPPPEPCSGEADQFVASNVAGPNSYCNPVNNCGMRVVSRQGATATIRQTTESCVPGQPWPDEGAGEPSGDEPTSGDNESCQSVGDGSYCQSASGDGQCGYMNDSYICLNQVAPDECKVGGDGGRVCGSAAATTPPVPDDGTPGHPAAPSGTISTETVNPDGSVTNNTYNYYNSSTVAGSSRDPGTSGAGHSSGVGASPGAGPSDADVNEQLGAPGAVTSETVEMSTALHEDTIVLGGSCPEPPTVTVFGSTISLTAITYFCELASMISGLVLAAAYVAAALIVVKGV